MNWDKNGSVDTLFHDSLLIDLNDSLDACQLIEIDNVSLEELDHSDQSWLGSSELS